MADNVPVSTYLKELGIPHRIFKHAGPVKSLEQAANERGQTPEQIIRSILFRLEADVYLMVLAAGPEQIPWKVLRRVLQVSRVTMADKDTVQAITGYPIGAVSPFGLPSPLRVLADQRVFIPDEISIGSGVRGTTVILSQPDFQQALGEVEVISLWE